MSIRAALWFLVFATGGVRQRFTTCVPPFQGLLCPCEAVASSIQLLNRIRDAGFLSPVPDKVAPEAHAGSQCTAAPLVNRPFGYCPLCSHTGDDAVHVRLHHHPAHYHLGKRRVQRLEVEDQVQLADIFEELIKRFNVDLDQVDERQRRLGRRRDDDEVECCVVSVRHEGGDVVLLFGRRMRRAGGGEERRKRQEVARSGRPVRDQCEDFGNEALLYAGFLGFGVSGLLLLLCATGPRTSCV